MAPPPPANLPLQERMMQLAQTLQFGWFVGHVSLLFSTFFYGLTYVTFKYNGGWAAWNYRVAFIAAAITYGIVVYKGFRARARQQGKAPSPQVAALQMIGDENVQYLLMAAVWLFWYQVPLALLPFAVYSVFHVATYIRANLLPTLQPSASASKTGPTSPSSKTTSSAQTSSGLADTLGRFVKTYYDTSMSLVAMLEIALWFRVSLGALSFARGSWILLVIYTAFFRSRYSQSSFVQGAFHNFAARIDALVASQSTPPVVKQAWGTVKNLVRQATEATDLRRYAGAQGAPKKAQ